MKNKALKLISLLLIMVCAVGLGGTSVSWMGTTFTIPATGESDWSGPTKVDGFLVSVGSNALSKAGGNYTLTADVNFGASFGLLAPYFSARSNAATTGFIRMDNGGSLSWRNAANSANLPLYVDSSNALVFNGYNILGSSGVVPVASGGTGLNSYSVGDTLYASGTTTLAKRAIGSSGLVSVANTSSPVWQKLLDDNVDTNAQITRSKLATGSANHVLINTAGGVVSSEAILDPSRGGTGNASYATGTILYAPSNGSSLAQLPIGSAGQVLKVAASLPSWGSAASALAVATEKSSGYTIQSTDDYIPVNSSGGSLMLTLPSASANSGKVYKIKKTDSSFLQFGVKRAGTDSVRDVSANTETQLATPGEEIELVSNGVSSWDVIGRRNSMLVGITVTPTNFGTVGTTSYTATRMGNILLVKGRFASGTLQASAASIDLPTGVVIDSTKLSSGANSAVLGYFHRLGTGGSAGIPSSSWGPWPMFYDGSTTTSVFIAADTNATNYQFVKENATNLGSNSDVYTFEFRVPIVNWN